MKITIQNLGVISQCVVDLKPLTIFVGANNTGKTWTAYTLAGILGQYGRNKYQEAYSSGNTQEAFSPVNEAVEQLIAQGNAKINLVEFADSYGDKYIADVARLSSSWMGDFFATLPTRFNEFKISIKLEETKNKFLQNVLKYSANRKISSGQKRKSPLVTISKESGDETLYYYTEGDITEQLPLKRIKEILIAETFKILHKSMYADTVPFPTERATIVTFPFPLITLSMREIKEDIGDDEKSSKIANRSIQPASDFFSMLYRLNEDGLAEDEHRQLSPSGIFVKLANFMEDKILSGSIGFKTEPDRFRKLIYHPNNDVELEMPIVSSMVKELSTLVLYLRHAAEIGDLIIIDEPEMNLHPIAQVEIIEFLCMLVNAGLNVLITTHSPYILDHLSNLIYAKECGKKDEDLKELFYLERSDSFISKENVSVHLFENNTAKNIINEDGDINLGTFSDTSRDISRIYSYLIN